MMTMKKKAGKIIALLLSLVLLVAQVELVFANEGEEIVPQGLIVNVSNNQGTSSGVFSVVIQDKTGVIKGGEVLSFTMPSYLRMNLASLPPNVFEESNVQVVGNTYYLTFREPVGEALLNATIEIRYTIDMMQTGDPNNEQVTFDISGVDVNIPAISVPGTPGTIELGGDILEKWIFDNHGEIDGEVVIANRMEPITYRIMIKLPEGIESLKDVVIYDYLSDLVTLQSTGSVANAVRIMNASRSTIKDYSQGNGSYSGTGNVTVTELSGGGFSIHFSEITETVILEYKVKIRTDLDYGEEVELSTSGLRNQATLTVEGEDEDEVVVVSRVQTVSSLFIQKKVMDASGNEVDAYTLMNGDTVTFNINLLTPKGYSPLIGDGFLTEDVLDSRLQVQSVASNNSGEVDGAYDAVGHKVVITQKAALTVQKSTIAITAKVVGLEPGEVLRNVVNDQPVIVRKPVELNVYKTDSAAVAAPLAGAVFSVQVVDSAGNVKATLPDVITDGTGYAQTIKYYPQGMLSGDTWRFKLTETTAPEGYLRNPDPVYIPFTLNSEGKVTFTETATGTFTHTMTNDEDPMSGTAIFTKTDLSGAAITVGGGSFRLLKVLANGSTEVVRLAAVAGVDGRYTTKNGTLTSFSLPTNGTVTIIDIDNGTYRIEELTAPLGYRKLADENFTADFEVQSAETATRIVYPTLKNEEFLGRIDILKVADSADGSPIANVQFTIQGTNLPAGYTATRSTNNEGKLTFDNLPYGTYTVTETVPYGYTGRESGVQVSIGDGDATPTITVLPSGAVPTISGENADLIWVNNTLYGSIQLNKLNDEGGYLRGATFQLKQGNTVIKVKEISENTYAADPDGDETFTTGMGPLVIGNLPYGSYTLTELSAPENYKISGGTLTITVGATIAVRTVTNAKKTGEIAFTKTDSATGRGLQGAEFKLTGTDFTGKTVAEKTAVSGTNGVVRFSGLPYGTYTVTETKAPNGFSISETAKTFILSETAPNHIAADYQWPNTQIPGKIVVNKTGTGGVPLAGATFRISGANLPAGYETDRTTTGDSNVLTWDNLPHGTYTITEIAAPDGYSPASPITVTIPGSTSYHSQYVNYTRTVANTQRFGSVTLTKVDAVAQYVRLSGVEFTIEGANLPDGYTVTRATDANGEVSFTSLPYGTYTITETKGKDGYKTDSEPRTFTISDAKRYYSFSQYNDINCWWTNTPDENPLRIMKIDADDGTLLAGAEFTLTTADGTPVKVSEVYAGTGVYRLDASGSATFTTGASGIAVFQHLDAGTYLVTEITAPSGYKLNDEPVEITITGGSESVTVAIENDKEQYPVRVIKREKIEGGNGTPLAGAQFRIVGLSNDINEVLTTEGEGGYADTLLPAGTYIVTEIYAPEGYQMDAPFQILTITGENDPAETIELTFENTPVRGSIMLTKTDDEGNVLEGVEFSLQRINDLDEPIGDAVTQASLAGGLVYFGNVAYGRYLLTETTPQGYLPEDGRIVEITANGELITFTVVNTPIRGQLSVLKLADDETTPLSGAEFTITAEDGSTRTAVTNAEGIAVFENLRYGAYTLAETRAPKGYVISESSRNIVIAEDGETVEETFLNEKILGSVELTKLDGSGEVLDGAQFQLIDSANNPVGLIGADGVYEVSDSEDAVTTFTTLDGKAVITGIPEGAYAINETESPEGYAKFGEPFLFEITAENYTEAHQAEFINPRIVRTVSVLKRDAETHLPLRDATFLLEILGEDGIYTAFDAEKTTGESGRVVFEDLATGEYRILEVEAPYGYVLDESMLTFSVLPDGTITNLDHVEGELYSFTWDNVKQVKDLRLRKISSATELGLTGAEFTVVGEGKTFTLTSSVAGYSNVIQLPVGEYEMYETAAPANYQLRDTVYAVSVTPEGIFVDGELLPVHTDGNFLFVAENDPTPVSLTLYKRSQNTGLPLYGATFVLSGNGVNRTLVSGTNGYTGTISLAPGTYTLAEITAPTGYIRNVTGWTITVTNSGSASIRGSGASIAYVNGSLVVTVNNTRSTTITPPITPPTPPTPPTTPPTIPTTPPTTVIDDEDVPLGPLPNTGEMSTLMFTQLGVIMILLAVIGFLSASLIKDSKRRRIN